MKGKKTTLRSGQEIWTSGSSRKNMLPGKQTISVGGRKKHKKKKGNFPVRVLICLILVTILCGVGAWYITKPQEAKPRIEKGDIYVNLQGSELTVTWPEITGADVIRLYRVRNGQPDTLCGEYTGSSAILSGIAPGELVYLRIEAVKFSENMLGEAGENIAKTKTVRIIPAELEQPVLRKKVDLESQTVNLNWEAIMGNSYELFQFKGDTSPEIISYKEVQGGTYPITFDTVTKPGEGHVIDVAIRAVRKGDGYVCTSNLSQRILVRPEDLTGLDLSLAWEQNEDRIYTLHWQETKGDCCELQQWSEEQQTWLTLKIFNDWSEDLTYTTDRLPSCTKVRFRTLAYEGDRMLGKLAVEPSEISFWTSLSSLYCTVWPIQELKLYADSEGTDTLGKVPAGEALCVLGETNDRFNVRYNGAYGYIDARYCMINLTEYLGDLCEYDIRNSYQSIFQVYKSEIPEITSTVIPGYETVCLSDDKMLVPLLYPCAKRLEEAARAVREGGYCLRIYDAFRPHKATRFLYDTTEKFIFCTPIKNNWTTLINTWDKTQGKYERATRAKQLREDGLLDRMTEAQFIASLSPEEQSLYYAGAYFAEQDAVLKESADNNYLNEMTNDRYSLASFLARDTSTHNYGIALDLTLVNLDTGAAVFMQSDMHDLSWHSVLSLNTREANLLSKYMKDVGFNDLSSEWWHFQDDTTRKDLGLKTYLEEGVSIEGWKRDDKGWKYRCADGSYYAGVTIPVNGSSCTFNEEGYLQ